MATIILSAEGDRYTAGVAGDVIDGADGNDTLTASEGGNHLQGGAGDDVLNGRAGSDTLIGDSSTNYSARNVINGFAGDDVISSLSWYDRVNAGSGNDFVNSYAQITNQVVDGGTGYDRLYVSSLINEDGPINFTMGATLVFIVGGINGATYMNFETVEVTLGTGAVTAVGGRGDDRIFFAYKNGTNATVSFEAGSVQSGGGDDNVAFNGLARVGSGTQQLDGGAGEDRLSWTTGAATIGDLTINATLGTMTADGTRFATFSRFETLNLFSFTAISGDYSHRGFAGVDQIYLGAATSVINTLGGNDDVTVTAGQATVDGGSGNDLLRMDYPNASRGTLYGDLGNDSLIGGSGANVLYGGTGDDVISTVVSQSQIFGGGGDDMLSFTLGQPQAGQPAGRVEGGAGFDRLALSLIGSTEAVTVALTAPLLTFGGVVITGIEAFDLRATLLDDVITASNDQRGAAVNLVDGSNGNDTLTAGRNGASLNGGVGADLLTGLGGDDLLSGGLGGDNDRLQGGGGDDTLIGGIGRDLLFGGAGADHFTLAAYYESGTTDTTRDRIFDFVRTQGDKIDLTLIDAEALSTATGDQAFTFIGRADFGNHAGELRYDRVDVAGSDLDITLVQGDINGDGVADFTVELRGLFTLQEGDFLL